MSALPFIVKVCGVTSAEDAAMATSAGANAIGLNFWPGSKRYVTPQPWMRDIDALRVGVFVRESPGTVERIAAEAALDIAQVYGDDAPATMRVWRAIRPGDTLLPAEAYVYDVSEGEGIAFDWSLAAAKDHPVVLAGGLDGSNVGDAIRAARPWGVDACSKLELAPGRKDPERVRAFVAAARKAFGS